MTDETSMPEQAPAHTIPQTDKQKRQEQAAKCLVDTFAQHPESVAIVYIAEDGNIRAAKSSFPDAFTLAFCHKLIDTLLEDEFKKVAGVKVSKASGQIPPEETI